jgi:glycerophosphoryl diester phosphodiesterase
MKSMLWLMLSALSFLTCKYTETRPVAAPPGFDWQGHRGCRGLMPENTVPAFLKALEFPQVVTLELDLAVSKDGQIIVSHEPWFNPVICRQPGGDSIPRSDGEKFLLFERTAAEIRAFDCGSLPNPRFPRQQLLPAHKPTLREVVEAVQARSPAVRWNIEIKSQPAWDGLRHPPVDEFARLVLAEVKTLGIQDRTTLQSFDVRALQALHRLDHGQTIALLVENMRGLNPNLDQLGFQPAIYSPHYLLVTRKLVRDCHARGIKVVPWTVNDVPAMRKLIRLGVDGIITDYPDLIREVGE